MAEIYEFGVTRSDVGRYLPRFAFDNISAPTETEGDAIITDHAADLCAFLYGMGVNVETLNAAPTSAMYRTCQRYIILRFSAQVMRLRQQNSATLADRLDDEAAGIIERLRKLPQDMGATRPTSVHSPNIMHSNADYPEAIYSKSIASRSRLAINATQDKM
jgi:hypothetical protein